MRAITRPMYLPGADDDAASPSQASVIDLDQLAPQARAMVERGSTASEIARELGIGKRDAAMLAGAPSAAQMARVAQVLVDRAVGSQETDPVSGELRSLAPHVQAAQFLLGAHVPETYGRQAAAGSTNIRVIVDRTGELRRASCVMDGEVIPSLERAPE